MSARRPKKSDRIPSETEGSSGGVRLSPDQREIAKRLGELQLGGKRGELRKIYVAAIGALEDKANPDRGAHCATSLRRVVEALFGTGNEKVYGKGYGRIYGDLSEVIHYNDKVKLEEHKILDRFEKFINEIVFNDIIRIKKAINKGDNVKKMERESIIKLVKLGRDHGYFFAHVESYVWLEPLKQESLLNIHIEEDKEVHVSWPAQKYLNKLTENDCTEALRIVRDEMRNLRKYYKTSPEDLAIISHLSLSSSLRLSEATSGDKKARETVRESFKLYLIQKIEHGYSLDDSHDVEPYLKKYPQDAIGVLIDIIKDYCEVKNFKNGPEKKFLKLLLEACKFFYKANCGNPERLLDLDMLLRDPIPAYGYEGHLFDNVRYALYGHSPNQMTREWIKEAIISYKGYAKKEYSYHFQKMIRVSFERFGENWITKNELTPIFESILSGPNRVSWQQTGNNLGKLLTDDDWERRRNYFQKMQLRPFESALFGPYKDFWEGFPAVEKENMKDENYFRDNFEDEIEFFPEEHRSPITVERLGQMNDEQLVDYLENWNAPSEGEEGESVDFIGLSDVLGKLVLEEAERFFPWEEEEWLRIRRPVYFLAFVKAARRRWEVGYYGELDRWLNLMNWISRRHEQEGEKWHQEPGISGELEFTWDSVQLEVSRFLSMCIGRVSFDCRDRILKILEVILRSPDLVLEKWKSGDSWDALTEAINTKRGAALEALIKDYPRWVQHHRGNAARVPEVFENLEKRLSEGPTMTPPEHALLGCNLGRLFRLDRAWVMRNKAKLLPLEDSSCWKAAFGCLILEYGPGGEFFEIFEADYFHAVEGMEELGSNEMDRLGLHAFYYWLWDENPGKNLIESFFEKADSAHRSNLIHRMGRLFREDPEENEEEYLQTSIGRAQQFIEQRIKKGDIDELVGFETWIDADCFDTSWRLDTLEKILKKGTQIPWHAFSKVLMTSKEQYPRQVMVCFLEAVKHSITIWLENDNDRAEEILRFGLTHPNTKVSNLAMKIREQLLQLGYDRIVDLE